MPIRRKTLVTFLGEIAEFILAVVDHWKGALTSSVLISVGLTVYQLSTGETLTLKPYLWLLVIVGLPVAVFLAWAEEYRGREKAQNEIDQLRLTPVPDGVIYRENIEHRRRITELEKQLRDAAPRDIPLDQRARIVQRLSADMPTINGENVRPWRVNVVPLSNVTDSNQFARAIIAVLETSFDPEMGGSDSLALAHIYSLTCRECEYFLREITLLVGRRA